MKTYMFKTCYRVQSYVRMLGAPYGKEHLFQDIIKVKRKKFLFFYILIWPCPLASINYTIWQTQEKKTFYVT